MLGKDGEREWGKKYQLCHVLNLFQTEPYVMLFGGRSEGHQRHGTEPGGFAKRPDEEAGGECK